MASTQKIASVIATVLLIEGGFVNDPVDPGGATNFGITQATADRLGLGDVRFLTPLKAAAAYNRLFDEAGITAIPDDATFGLVADACVNHGDAYGIDWLQTAIGAKVDGDIGPKTRAALQAVTSWLPVYASILAQRVRFYGQIITHHPAMAKFAGGWMARAATFIDPFPTWLVKL